VNGVLPSASERLAEDRRFVHGTKDRKIPYKSHISLVPPRVPAGVSDR
jgi:hypothetical protein